ncbi:MAG: hypothetical protein M1819_004884 [Sarea resinae]|nr:MAG: hypothetical protein M1819_004884 [Sarea resinae]
MAAQDTLPPDHHIATSPLNPTVKDPPKFDLEAYIANYEGRTRFDRLYLIGRTSAFLSHDALKAAVAEAKHGEDVSRYQLAVDSLRQTAPEDPDATIDMDWVDFTKKRVKAETEKLEFELKGYKNNLIKESIRMGNEDLGLLYHRIGDLSQAYKCYSRMRDYCTTPKNVFDMNMRLVVTCIEQGNWMSVLSNVQKIQNLLHNPDDEAKFQPYVCASRGLAQLGAGNYKEAAVSFLRTDPSLGSQFKHVLTSNDVAVYGGICALASMDRAELQDQVLKNSSFRNFLALEPHIRRAITLFCNSKYSQCLDILEAYKTDYLLDIYLQPHVADLYRSVRTKSIVQYFIPFSTVTLDSMAQAFGTDEGSIEDELVAMIQSGALNARIDTQNKVLTAIQTDLRSTAHREATTLVLSYKQAAYLHLTRMNLLNAGLEVKAPKNYQSREAADLSRMGDVFHSHGNHGHGNMGKGSLRTAGGGRS